MQRLTRAASGLSHKEYALLAALSTPVKIQDYLDTIPVTADKESIVSHSPEGVMHVHHAQCIDGAMLAATALWIAGEPPIIMNLSARLGRGDEDHVIALYKRGGYYGAISKTNHPVLRYRDPVYRSPRELALSFFNEWFLFKNGEKTLECYSKPLDLSKRFGSEWITAERDVTMISDALSVARYYFLVPPGHWRYLRPADGVVLRAASLVEWKDDGTRAFGKKMR